MADKKLPAIMIATPIGVAFHDTLGSAMKAISAILRYQMENPDARQSLKIIVYDRYTITDNSPHMGIVKSDE